MAVVNFFRIIYPDDNDNVQCPIAIMTQILLDCMTGYWVLGRYIPTDWPITITD